MKRAAIVLLLVACSEQKPRISPDIATRDISIAVRGDPATPGRLVATLIGPGGEVILLPPDRLVVAQGAMEWPMVHVAKTYVGDIGSAHGNFALRLLREGDDVANVSFVVPPPFTVKTAPLMSRAAGMTFTWDGQVPSAEVSFSVGGACVVGLARPLATDTGSYAINAGELQSSTAVPSTCDVTLTVTRTWGMTFTTRASTVFTSSP